MHRTLLIALLFLAACSSPAGDSDPSTPSTPVAPPVSVTTTTSTTQPSTTTTTEPLEPSTPAFDTWAIVLESIPKDEASLAEAFDRGAEFESPTDVLDSDAYPSLNPGFWVVFNGPYDSQTDADMRCAALQGSGCYTRYLGVTLDAPVGFEYGTALVSVEGGLGIFDLDSGDRIRTIAAAEEARYRAQPQLALGGTVAFFAGSVEDSWFSCDSAQGFIDRLDLSTGEFDQYAAGSVARVSPGGRYLAYVESSTCIPDPFDAQFFLAVPDTIVVVDLSTDQATRWEPGVTVVGEADSFVTSLAWGSNPSYLLAVLGDGTLRRLEPAQPMPVDELPIVDTTFVDRIDLQSRASSSVDLIAGRSETSVIAHRWSSIGSGRDGEVLSTNEIVELDPRSGAIQRTVVILGDAWPLVSVDDANGNLLVVDSTGALIYDPSARFPDVEVGSGGADW